MIATLAGLTGYLVTRVPMQPTTPPNCNTSGAVPDCKAAAPPGFEGFLYVLVWAKWIAVILCIVAIIVAGVTFAMSRRGEAPEHAKQIGYAIIGTLIVGGATALVGFILT